MTAQDSLFVYYTDLDKLMVQCVYPLLNKYQAGLDHYHWERHYAGGPHLRIRLKGKADNFVSIAASLTIEIEDYIARMPSEPLQNYSSVAVKRLLAMEEEEVSEDELLYRVNKVVRRQHDSKAHKLASDEAVDLLTSFHRDSMPLAVAILNSSRSKQEEALRMFFWEALFAGGTLPGGVVSFKSHWEGLAAFNSVPAVNERIVANYQAQRQSIEELMLEVAEIHAKGSVGEDAILKLWDDLLNRYQERAKAILASGKHITFQFANTEQVRNVREKISSEVLQESSFIRALWEDERFLASIQYEPLILVPRILTNLLYSLLPVIGLKFVDKLALCFYAHRAVEDHFQCDLTAILRQTMGFIIERHREHLELS